MISLVLVKKTDNFTGVLNRLVGSEAISEVKCIIRFEVVKGNSVKRDR
jgi:hypothetical protein